MSPEITYFIYPDAQSCTSILQYLFSIQSLQFDLNFNQVEDAVSAEIQFSGSKTQNSYYCDVEVYSLLQKGIFPGSYESLGADPLLQAYYLLLCMQEYNAATEHNDIYRRFQYKDSLQAQQQTVKDDKISELFLLFIRKIISDYKPQKKPEKKILLTHDIDILNGGLRKEFFAWCRDQGNYSIKHLINHLSGKKKIWNNIEEIIHLEEKYNANSVFYFIPETGIYNQIKNADYQLSEIKKSIATITSTGNEIGLHKSSKSDSYEKEMAYLNLTNPLTNRNHYLRYQLPDNWVEMEAAGIQLDTGLCFPYESGLKNNYPFPFHPFVNNVKLNLLVMPMIMMDTAYDKYSSAEKILSDFIALTSRWKNGFCVSILFHNNYLTAGANHSFLKAYEEILAYCNENEIQFTSCKDVVNQFN